jgi:hypothetical protein
MNAAVIVAALLAIPSVHSAPSPNSWNWLKTYNFRPAAPSSNYVAPVATTGFCIQHKQNTTTLVKALLANRDSYYVASSTMTRSLCKSRCDLRLRQAGISNKDLRFYAVFDASRCYCLSTRYNELVDLEQGQCSSPCAGNRQETCGGPTSSYIDFSK